ncbi:RNA polymerase subunit sigma-24 [Chromatiales bacterium (ex Bugula neritina AB1)]|nr:RNA polymerase subunit sigma-24 [Chromatiales bacterium (ex Bugula neritina AB1)]
MLPPLRLEQAITHTVREEWGRILASLVKTIGDLQLAEDVLQDAVEIALSDWKKNGLPKSPAGWLIQTARRKAIDRLRRDRNFAALQPQISYLLDLQNNSSPDEIALLPDKRLELIFTCCHPALDQKTRIALTLRTLGGLTTEEIARTFLDKPEAMAQRLVRAKKKIALAGIPYELPDSASMQSRLAAVLAVLYFIFNEGYTATSGTMLARDDLASEAIRLARIMLQLMPDQAEVAGLLCLMLLHDSRRFARQNSDGEMVPLEFQNRNQWDKHKIEEGRVLLQITLRRQQIGVYQLQACVSALHSEASSWEDTDWKQICSLYELLYAVQPSPVVRINQAIAISYSESTESALEVLKTLEGEASVADYQPYFAARADVCFRAGDTRAAIVHLKRAIELSENQREKQFLQKKLHTMERGSV